MPKWKHDKVVNVGSFIVDEETDTAITADTETHCIVLTARHNADIDALTAENKQLTIDYELTVKSRNWQYEAHMACKKEIDRLVAENAELREGILSLRERMDKLSIERSAFMLKREDVIPDPKLSECHGWTGLTIASTHVDGMGCVDSVEFYWDKKEENPERNLAIAFRASRGGLQGPGVFVREEDLQSIVDYISPRIAANATLDKLRIWIPKDMYKRGYSLEDLERCHAELYPPETPNG